jgi:hypothetical protein
MVPLKSVYTIYKRRKKNDKTVTASVMATLIELEWISTKREGNQRLVLPVCRSSRVEVRSTGYPPASMHLCTYVYTLFGVTYALARRKRDAPAGAPTQQKGGSPQDICRQQHNTKAGASSRGVERSTVLHTKNKQQIRQKAEDKIWGGVHAGG